ncbi:methylated-DNA--[protein]-cysteine S-methyltransferase [Draconibacterium halophilum]|uniref:Methylated-DNA--protein-cysteine methyltransferase n=2 Tax=Draconibacterium halophilum TaxID=2706887 RepID=A0A6C0RHK2_9BACT|nr:methylated-DNA--[protein]-cysteine S-methyltransferase [Draconibacterium halophilum]
MGNFKNYINSPIGWLELEATANALCAVRFKSVEGIASTEIPEILNQTRIQLEEYFSGERKEFNLNIEPHGTEFQQKVWNFVERVKFGTTASYLDIAKQTGSDKNTRAVGLANGKNPIPIIIPCHRIIGSSGKLTGYAGGIERKRWLLNHERSHTPSTGRLF